MDLSTAIRLDNPLWEHRYSHRFSPSLSENSRSEPEPMEVEVTHLPAAERHRRRQMGLCLYCGQGGHQLQWCLLLYNVGIHKSRGLSHDLPPPGTGVSIPSSSLSAKPLLVSITLVDVPHVLMYSPALVDSGAKGNFIDQTLASSLNIISYPLSSPFPVKALDNRPL